MSKTDPGGGQTAAADQVIPVEQLTAEQVGQLAPRVADALREQGARAERERVTAILQAAAEPQHDLALSLIESGRRQVDAVSDLNKDLKARFSEQTRALNTGAPLGAGNPDPEAVDEAAHAARAKTAQPGAPLSKAQFEHNQRLVEQHGDYAGYLAYCAAVKQGSVRAVGQSRERLIGEG